MTLIEALKFNVKVDWLPFHVSQKMPYCLICVSIVTGAFSHNNHVYIDTFSHVQLYSAHTEVSRPIVKHFLLQYHCWYQEDNVRCSRPSITYIGTTLRSRTRKPTHKTLSPLNKCYTFWDSMIWSGVKYWHQKLSRLLL